MLIILRGKRIIENQFFVDKNLINEPPYGGSLSSGVVFFPFVNLFSFHHQFGLSSFLQSVVFDRLYNILKPSTPEETISLGESSSLTAEYSQKSISIGSSLTFAAALGEKAIAFDFAPAVRDTNPKARLSSSDSEPDVAYPVFILRENGDIFYLLHRISQIRYITLYFSIVTRTVSVVLYL